MLSFLLCFLPWWEVTTFDILLLSILLLIIAYGSSYGWYIEAKNKMKPKMKKGKEIEEDFIYSSNLIGTPPFTLNKEDSHQARLHASIVFPSSLPDNPNSAEFPEFKEEKNQVFLSLFMDFWQPLQ